MLLILCNDDAALVAAAQHDAATNPPVFGGAQQFIGPGTPVLGAAENLFSVAHGIQGELGNANGHLGYNALELLNYLINQVPNGRGGSLFPAAYTGSVYVSVCYGANPQPGLGLSFIEQLHALTRPVLRNTSVLGHFGAVAGPVPPPATPGAWVQVANT